MGFSLHLFNYTLARQNWTMMWLLCMRFDRQTLHETEYQKSLIYSINPVWPSCNADSTKIRPRERLPALSVWLKEMPPAPAPRPLPRYPLCSGGEAWVGCLLVRYAAFVVAAARNEILRPLHSTPLHCLVFGRFPLRLWIAKLAIGGCIKKLGHLGVSKRLQTRVLSVKIEYRDKSYLLWNHWSFSKGIYLSAGFQPGVAIRRHPWPIPPESSDFLCSQTQVEVFALSSISCHWYWCCSN